MEIGNMDDFHKLRRLDRLEFSFLSTFGCLGDNSSSSSLTEIFYISDSLSFGLEKLDCSVTAGDFDFPLIIFFSLRNNISVLLLPCFYFFFHRVVYLNGPCLYFSCFCSDVFLRQKILLFHY